MKKLLGGIAISAFLAAPALAADLPARMPVKAAPAPVVAVYSWTGCYIGGHGGWARARTQLTNTANTTAFGDLAPGQGFSVSDSGGIAGGHIGCNWQNGQFVFGIEGAGGWLGIKTSFLNTVFGAADDTFEIKSSWIASIAGRAGIAVNNWLFYAKGGFAASGWKVAVSDFVGANQGSGNDKNTHTGFVVGGGIEYGLTPNWIIGVEYDYYRFNSQSYQLAGTAAPASYAFDFKPRDVHAVVGRLSYKFGGPVVARY
jgi:outer membrane immunogenic protein